MVVGQNRACSKNMGMHHCETRPWSPQVLVLQPSDVVWNYDSVRGNQCVSSAGLGRKINWIGHNGTSSALHSFFSKPNSFYNMICQNILSVPHVIMFASVKTAKNNHEPSSISQGISVCTSTHAWSWKVPLPWNHSRNLSRNLQNPLLFSFIGTHWSLVCVSLNHLREEIFRSFWIPRTW